MLRPTIHAFVIGCIPFFAIPINVVIFINIFSWPSQCPTVGPIGNQRVCNGHGACIEGVCVCEPFFSGEACGTTQLAGYIQTTGMVCGNGKPNPNANISTIIPSCNPSKGGSWSSSTCVSEIAPAISAFYNHEATAAQIRTIPICLCRPGWTGADCSDPACPESDLGYICDNHGNHSVGLINNNTNLGNGCQCNNPSNLLPYYRTLTPDFIMGIMDDFTFYLNGFCGELYRAPDDPSAMLVIQGSYSCHCEDPYYGEVCAYGACPTVAGDVCGQGNKDFGFNFYANRSTNCTVGGHALCAPGLTKCPNDERCVGDMNLCNYQSQCPSYKPYRCPDGTCAYAATPTTAPSQCVGGYIYGYLDDVSSALSFCVDPVFCWGSAPILAVDAADPLNTRGRLKGELNFSSPLVFFSFQIVKDGYIEIRDQQFGGIAKHIPSSPSQTYFSGVFQTYAEDFYSIGFYVLYAVYVEYQQSSNQYYMFPVPFKYSITSPVPSQYTVMRLQGNDVQSMVVNLVGSSVVVITDETILETDSLIVDGVAVTNFGQILRPDGSVVSTSACYSDLVHCSWNRFTLLSMDGTKKLCQASSGDFYVSVDFSCSNTSVSYVVATVAFFEPQAPQARLVASGWTLFGINTEITYNYSVYSTAIVKNVEYLTVDDIQAPCACLSAKQNQSVYNLQWINDPTRSSSLGPGEPAVGYANIDGYVIPVRGVVSNADPPYMMNVSGFQNLVRVFDAKLISPYEFTLGANDLPRQVLPVLCPTGSASRVGYSSFTVTVQCSCVASLDATIGNYCTCYDPLSPSTYCVCEDYFSGCVCFQSQDAFLANQTFVEGAAIAQNITVNAPSLVQGTSCVVSRAGNPDPEFQQGVYNSSDGYWYFRNEQQDYFPGLPRSFEFQLTMFGEDEHLNTSFYRLQGRPKFFSDVFFDVPFEYMNETINNTVVIIPVFPVDYLYTQWRLFIPYNITQYNSNGTLVTSVNQTTLLMFPVVYWSPTGLPLSEVFSPRNLTVSVSSGSLRDGIDLLYNSFEYWSSSPLDHDCHVMISFPSPTYVSAAWIDLRSVALPRDDGIIIPVRVYLQYSTTDPPTKRSWVTCGYVTSRVVNGSDAVLLPVEPPVLASAIRLHSFFPMAINVFSPITNQICTGSSGRLFDYTYKNAFYEKIVNEKLLNQSVPCLCLNDCTIAGVDVTSNGICEDTVYAFGPLVLKETSSSFVSVQQQVGMFFNLTSVASLGLSVVPVYRRLTDNFFYWGVNGTFDKCTGVCFDSLPVSPPLNGDNPVFFLNATDYCIFVYLSNSTLSQNFVNNQAPGAYNVLDVETGVWYYTVYQWVPVGLPFTYNSKIYCQAGDDCSDCGPSNRYAQKDPGVGCVPVSFYADYVNRTDYFTFENYPVPSFLQDAGTYFEFNLTFEREAVNVGYSNCTNCNLQLTCPDGTCVDSQCPPIFFRCDGNGCVQSDPNIKKFTCVCAKGYGGMDCSISDTTQADIVACVNDPAGWNMAGGPPPLRIKPPGGLVKQIYTTQQVAQLNNPEINGYQVTYQNVQPDFAPYGAVLQRYVSVGNATYCTTCPFMKSLPGGGQGLVTDFIESYNQDGTVASWVTFLDENNTPYQVIWSTFYSYDEYPLRCPATGQCVSQLSDCTLLDTIRPMCNGLGVGRADGTCVCNPGQRTFVFTEYFTASIEVPYSTNPVTGATNPTEWGVTNTNWRDWSTQWCKARDCSVVDCGPPMGCYMGNPALNFQDAYVPCPQSSGHYGFCGKDLTACRNGDVVGKLVCSGNGILRKRFYRGDGVSQAYDYYCVCGTPLQAGSQDTTDLQPNGWGGIACNEYYCTSNPGFFYWSKYKEPRVPYTDRYGNNLPGKWNGACGAFVGPKPEDDLKWKSCCPGGGYLDHCTNTLCQIGNDEVCIPITQCVGSSRKPLVAVCNGHGTPRADGSCECNTDTGGWVSDETVFSTASNTCYKRVDCPVSSYSGLVCNGKPSCGSEYDSWLLPPDPFFEQQISVLIARMGYAVTNQSYVRLLLSSIENAQELMVAAYVSLALQVIAANVQYDSCVCIIPGDNPSDPIGMAPYDPSVISYMKSYSYPYLLPYPNNSILADNVYYSSYGNSEFLNEYSVALNYTSGSDNGVLVVPFGQEYHISGIRIHGVLDYNGQTFSPMSLNFIGDSGSVCQPSYVSLEPMAEGEFVWVANGMIYCVDVYQNFLFQEAFPQAYSVNCGADPASLQCVDWMIANCPGNVSDVFSIDQYFGCNSVCCQLISKTGTPTTNLYISLSSDEFSYTGGITLYMDEIRIFGYTDQVLPFPVLLLDNLLVLDDSIGECQDERFISAILDTSNSYFVAGTLNNDGSSVLYRSDFWGGDALCEEFGAHLAGSIGGEPVTNYAEFTGPICDAALQKDNLDPAQGCVVAGRDINFYPEMSQLIDPDCSRWGCWMKYSFFSLGFGETLSVDIYSVPYSSLYTEPIANTQLSWKVFANVLFETYALFTKNAPVVQKPGIPSSAASKITRGNWYDVFLTVATYSYVPMPPVFTNPYSYIVYNRPQVPGDRTSTEDYYTLISVFIYPSIPAIQTATFDDYGLNINYNDNPFVSGKLDLSYGSPAYNLYWNGITYSTVVIDGMPFQYRDINGQDSGSVYTQQEDLSNPLYKIERELWMRNDSCMVVLYNQQGCGYDIGVYMGSFESPASSPYMKVFSFTPGDDYKWLYVDLAEGGLAKFDQCFYAGRLGVTCAGSVFGGLPGVMSGNVLSASVFGNCTLYASYGDVTKQTPLVMKGSTASGLPLNYVYANSKFNGYFDPSMQSQYLSSYAVYLPFSFQVPNCYDVGSSYTNFHVYPEFSNIKTKITMDAEMDDYGLPGNTVGYTVGWSTNPYMCANVKMVPVNSISRVGFCVTNYTQNNCNPFNRQNPYQPADTYFGQGFQETYSGSLPSYAWGQIDFELYSLFRTYLPGNQGAQTPMFYEPYTISKDGYNSPFMYFLNTPDTFYLPYIFPNAQGGHDLYLPFTPCSEVGVYVENCLDCQKTLLPGNWQWDQKVWGLTGSFYTAVASVDPEGFQVEQVAPQMYVIDPFSLTLYYFPNTYVPLSSVAYIFPPAYAHLMATLTISDLNVNFWLDQCLKVVPRNDGSGLFMYTTSICVHQNYVLCEYDMYKYECQPGTQCDKCGCSATTFPYPEPGVTCTQVFSIVNATSHPFQNEVKNAYLSGSVQTLVETKNYNYDVLRAFIDDYTNYSFVEIFPDAVKFLEASISTCPGSTTPGQVTDLYSCLDFDMNAKFGFDCGTMNDPATNVPARWCAVSQKYCSFSNRYGDSPTSLFPTILLPLQSGDSQLPYNPLCGILVQPYSYVIRDAWGPPSPVVDSVLISELPMGGVQLQSEGSTVTWQNIGKNPSGYIFEPNTTTNVTGYVTCSACGVVVWISDMDPTYVGYTQRINYNVTLDSKGYFLFSVGDEVNNYTKVFQVIGWDISNLGYQEIFDIGPIVLSNQATVAACTDPSLYNITWYNPPSTIQSGQVQYNECVYSRQRANELYGAELGQCYCHGRALGGSKCDCLALDTIKGKGVCGTWGFPASMALAPDGSQVATDNQGCFHYSAQYLPWCKCMDVGGLFRTKRNPLQGSGFEVIVSVQRIQNTPDFETVTAPSGALVSYTLPYDYETCQEVCYSSSAQLPFFTTADELLNFYQFFEPIYKTQPSFFGVVVDPAADTASWAGLDQTFVPCVSCVSTEVTSSNIDAGMLQALNFNNLCFRVEPGFLFDGLMVDGNITSFPVSFNVSSHVNIGVTVVIYSTSASVVAVQPVVMDVTHSVDCGLVYKNTNDGVYQYSCTSSNVATIEVSYYTPGGLMLSEITCYQLDDTTRNLFFPV